MEFARLLAAFGVLFVVVPVCITTRRGDGPWVFRVAAAFVRVSLFFRIAIMFVGLVGANFPGIVVGLWFVWILASLTWSHGRQLSELRERVGNGFLRFLEALENSSITAALGLKLPLPRVSSTLALFFVLTAATLLNRAWYPLHNLRFAAIETYSRTLDLQKLLHRDAPTADGAAFLLAPLSVFGGLAADSVVRFSGPLFSTLLVLAVALCAYRFLRRSEAALMAAALMALWPLIRGIAVPSEISSAEMAAVYWLLSAAIFRSSWRLSVCAGATALLISWKVAAIILPATASVLLAYAFFRLLQIRPALFQRIALAAASVGAISLLAAADRGAGVDGPFEYEAAARASRAIASQFARNDWLIVSPVHELAFTYGNGWHFELIDFAYSYAAKQVSSPAFSFPYDVRNIFVFVEKQPLRSRGAAEPLNQVETTGLTQTMDRAVLAYQSGVGRASVEFRAGALMSAYMTHHAGVTIFQEDEKLVVFHIRGRSEIPATRRQAAVKSAKLSFAGKVF